jgi:hypothetical protein
MKMGQKWMVGLAIVGFAIALAFGARLFAYVTDDVDRCLDAGGSWDRSARRCDHGQHVPPAGGK